MSLILNIETATETCSVALALDGVLLQCIETTEPKAHATKLNLFIEEAMKLSGFAYKDLDAIAVSKGPGSYTGLRIGVSTAKGLCFALDKPLLSVNTLQSFAAYFKENILPTFLKENPKLASQEILLCPMLDARRMEVYTTLFDLETNFIEPTKALILNELSFAETLQKSAVIFFGNGATKWQPIALTLYNAWVANNCEVSAKGMVALSERLFRLNKFEDLAYFEPYYLKDFIALTSKSL